MPISLNKLMPYSDNPPSSPSAAPTNFAHTSSADQSGQSNSNAARLRKAGSDHHRSPRFRWPRSIRIVFFKSYPLRVSYSGFNDRRLPLRIRPAFCVLTIIILIGLTIIGFHPAVHAFIPIPKKLFHFFGFTLITGLFYSIPEVEDSSKFIWYWNHFNELVTGLVCFVVGGLGSELIQVFLPWKVFEWGDLVANELGCLVGYQLARSLHRQYRHKLELSKLYEPLGSLRSVDQLYDEEDDEDDGVGGAGQAKALFGGNRRELANVWSDQLEEGNEYFRFEDDDE